MGCYESRSYPPHSLPWAVLELLSTCNYTRLKTLQINNNVYPIPNPADDYLSPAQLHAIGVSLGVLLPEELFQEIPPDSRVSRKKVYWGLILMCDDDTDSKTAALHPFLDSNKRNWVKFLEWREELLSRLVRKAANMHLMDALEAKSELLSYTPKASHVLISTSERLWKVKSTKQALKDLKLCHLRIH